MCGVIHLKLQEGCKYGVNGGKTAKYLMFFKRFVAIKIAVFKHPP